MNEQTKFCKRCAETKSAAEFFRHPTNKDGLQTYCKVCSREIRKATCYDENGKYKYSRTPEARREMRRRYKKENAEKYKARKVIGDLVRHGRIKRQPCELCGKPNAEAHHEDYSKPRDVKWLCRKHHMEHHQKQRANQQVAA